MIKLTTLFTAIMVSFGMATVAQTNTFPQDGNVGIGTTNPQSKMEIAGAVNLRYNSNSEYWLKHTDINNNIISGFKREVNSLLIRAFDGIKFSVGNTENPVLNINSNGDIKATGNLHVSTGNATGAGIKLADDGDIVDLNDGWATHRFSYGLRITDGNSGGNTVIQFANGGTGYTYFNSGNVGIGTSVPAEKLSVNGKIRAHEIKVETSNWPDYVFDQDYQILGLTALESYIKANKHLPEMPSAKVLEKDGVELGEINKILVKKVEEMTLLMIEMNKILLSHQNEIKTLKAKHHE